MNVYTKLQKCRVLLQKMNLTKTGKNTFAGYDYFELGDFMPAINELFDEHGLFGYISFTSEIASLTILNTDKPEEQVVFTSPMAEANLKGCHAIQNVGAVETYQRRYLYTTALEIVEHDPLDKTTGKDAPQSQQNAPKSQGYQPSSKPAEPPTNQSSAPSNAENTVEMISGAQKGKIRGVMSEKKIPNDVLSGWVSALGLQSSNDLTKKQASDIIKKCEAYMPVPVPAGVDDDLPF